jgi:hypothetical protein
MTNRIEGRDTKQHGAKLPHCCDGAQSTQETNFPAVHALRIGLAAVLVVLRAATPFLGLPLDQWKLRDGQG